MNSGGKANRAARSVAARDEKGKLDSQQVVQHGHLAFELGNAEALDDAPVLHHIEAVGERRREAEVCSTITIV